MDFSQFSPFFSKLPLCSPLGATKKSEINKKDSWPIEEISQGVSLKTRKRNGRDNFGEYLSHSQSRNQTGRQRRLSPPIQKYFFWEEGTDNNR